MLTEEENVQVSGIYSKFGRIALVFFSMLLIFVGGTYIPYLMSVTLKIGYFASVSTGFILFLVGFGMMLFLIRKRIITI